MPKITREEVRVPADVMPEARDEYITNYLKATRETGRLMLFACDQKIEHLNKDFYGEGIDIADLDPEHLFKIGSEGVCGVLAGQRGLVAQYAADYPEINYLIKMNSKTNLVGTKQEDPYSPQLYDLDAVLAMKEAGVNIVGLGYTIYLGSEYEATMMAEAGELIAQAHANGLLVVLWIYPRGKAVTAEKDPALIAGAAGVALGSMVGSLTVGKKKYAAVEADIIALNVRAEALRKRLEALVQADAEAFLPVAAAYKLPKETPEQQAHKAAVLEKALDRACAVPLEVMTACGEGIALAAEYAEKGSVLARSDAGCAALFCKAAMQAAGLNVKVNTRLMADKAHADALEARAEQLLAEFVPQADRVYQTVSNE